VDSQRERFRKAALFAEHQLSGRSLQALACTIEAYLAVDEEVFAEIDGDESSEPPVSAPVQAIAIRSEPSTESVREAFDRLVQGELSNFADSLETARLVYKKYPKLVKAKRWPARLRAAYIAERNEEPESNLSIDSPVITREQRAELKKRAREIARCWMLRDQGFSESDMKALKAMGVVL
jgi:hypothetical protein